ncbi:MAG: RNA polymerase sigma-70 factor [Pedobacter sp.]|nr:MAG: RNA polymerase sigma-70 factor [Pedobacter sp.]
MGFGQTDMMQLFREGKEGALSHYFKMHGQSLIYFAGKLIADEMEAEDIVAQVFYGAWERRTSFENEQHLKSSLYVSCRNACLNFLRNQQRKSAAQEAYFHQLEAADDTVLYEVIEADYLEILNTEIEQLPEKMKEIFKLIYFDGKKSVEIALALGLSVKTVRNQKAKAVEILRTAILKKGLSATMSLAILFFLDS